MKVSVIIPAYNDWKRLIRCIDALQQQTMEKNQYEVIAIDNSETGKIPPAVNLPASVQLLHEPRSGSYIARNTGARRAAGEILAFTDSDCVPDKKWLSSAVDRFDQSDCDLIGGKVQIFNEDEQNKYGYLYESVTAFPQHKNVPEGKGVTANLFAKKQVFDETGGFDTHIISGGDWEFTQRCTDSGYKMIYCEKVLVLHPARTLAKILEKQKRMTCGGALTVKEKYGHSYLRMLGSHLRRGPRYQKKSMLAELSNGQRTAVYSIDTFKYFYRAMLYTGMFFRFIDPHQIRE